MKKMTRAIFLPALLALVLALTLVVPASAALPMVIDEAGLLSKSEAAALDQKLAAMSEKYQCDTVIATVGFVDEDELKDYMGDLYMSDDYGQGETYECIMLTYVAEDENWRIRCWGDTEAFTNAGLRFIGERMEEAGLYDGKYAAALDSFADWCERFYAQEATIGRPYDEGFLPPVDSAAKPAVLARDADDLSLLVDESALLSVSEAAALEEKLQALSEKWDSDIVIVTVDSIGSASPMDFADDWFDYGGYGRGGNHDGLLLLLNMGERDWWISTCGGAIDVFTDAGIEFLGKQLKADGLSDAKYTQAFNGFADWCDKFYAQAETGKPYDVGNLPKTSKDYAMMVLLGLGGGLAIAWIVTGGMKKKLKTVQKKQQAADYVRPGSLQVIYSNEQFLYKNVVRVKQESSSSSGGGGSSTHTSSSGTSHGGGGGKF